MLRDRLNWPDLRPGEWLLVSYFLYIAARAQFASNSSGSPTLIASIVLAVVLAAATAGSLSPGLFWDVVRNWLPAPVLLVSYRIVDCFAQPFSSREIENQLLHWDRILLRDWGVGAAVESLGPVIPTILEAGYLLLYAVPPLSIAYFYWLRRRNLVDKFLFTFLLGTLLAYAMLPVFPVQSPRLAYESEEFVPLPTHARQLNIAVLERFDIRTSVFPSGHVAVAFSAAFAMLLTLRENRWAGGLLLLLAFLVWLNTVYGRYHYAADGLVSLLLSMGASAVGSIVYPSSNPKAGALQ